MAAGEIGGIFESEITSFKTIFSAMVLTVMALLTTSRVLPSTSISAGLMMSMDDSTEEVVILLVLSPWAANNASDKQLSAIALNNFNGIKNLICLGMVGESSGYSIALSAYKNLLNGQQAHLRDSGF